MEKVVVSVDGTVASRAAVDWCAHHLRSHTTVIGVCGVSFLGEFVLGLPPFELSASRIGDCADTLWCEPLRVAGLRCTARLVHRRQVAALIEVARREGADLLVVGRQSHHGLGDIVFGKGFDHLVHSPPCPVMVVPATGPGHGATTETDSGCPMNSAIVDIDDPEAARTAWRWCADHLADRATVVVVGNADGPTGRTGSRLFDPSPARAEDDLTPARHATLKRGGAVEGLRVLPRHGVPIARLIAASEPDVVVVSQPEHTALTGLAHLVGADRLVRLIDGAACPVVILPSPVRPNLSPPRPAHGQPPLGGPGTHVLPGTGTGRGATDPSGGARSPAEPPARARGHKVGPRPVRPVPDGRHRSDGSRIGVGTEGAVRKNRSRPGNPRHVLPWHDPGPAPPNGGGSRIWTILRAVATMNPLLAGDAGFVHPGGATQWRAPASPWPQPPDRQRVTPSAVHPTSGHRHRSRWDG